MAGKLRTITTVTIVAAHDLESYAEMTPHEALEYEQSLPMGERLELFVSELAGWTGEPGVLVAFAVDLIPE